MMNRPLQQQVLDNIDDHGVIQLTSELVKVSSITRNEAQVSALLARTLRKLGFEVELYELREHNSPQHGRSNVVWRIKGTGEGPSLMFNGHLDTEPIAPGYDEIGEDPFSGDIRDDGHIYGLGTVNMKGGIAAFVYAMKALLDAGFTPKGDIIGAAVVGNEEYGVGTRLLMEYGLIPDMSISGEPTNIRIRPAHTGITDVSVTLKGKPTHMAYPEKGEHVLPKLVKLVKALENFRITYDEEKYKGYLEPKFNVGYIHGGYEFRTGLYLDSVSLGLSVRGPKGVTPQSVREDFDRLISELQKDDPSFKAEVRMLNPTPHFYPPYEASEEDYVYQAVARAHREVTGKEVEISAPTYGGGDIAILQYLAGVPCVMYGPGGVAGPFTPPERARISDITTATRTYALAAWDIGSKTWDQIK